MQAPSSYAYLKKRQIKGASTIKKQAEYGISNFQEDLDLNVFVLRFDKLKEAEKSIGVGDPFFCTKCKSGLNKFSKVLTKKQYQEQFLLNKEKVETNENQIKAQIPLLLELTKNASAWICQFCGTHNSLLIEKEQIPIKDDIVYMLESANQNKQIESDNASTIIFCIDNSGSMNSTSQITGKVDLKHGISEAQLQMLKQFMQPGDQIQLNNITGKTYISRKQCVMAAIESQLSDIVKNDPNKKVGLITFNNQVVVFGDCSKQPVNILGDKLNKKDNIINDITPIKIQSSVKQSYDKILGNFNKIQASGATALGPAILSSIQIASKGKVGSAVVICTDGLANIGLGNFEGDFQGSKVFYQQLAQKAKANNIAINIVSIKGQGCKLQALGVLAKQTNGNVSIVSPDEIQNKFANFLKDQIVATKVQVKIRLHKAVEFRNQFPQNIHEQGTLLIKELANATVKTKVSFQYQLKTEDVLQQMGINLDSIKQLPFQAQVIYTTTEGHRFIRIVTSTLNTSTDKKVVQKHIQKINVVHDRLGQQTAFMVQRQKAIGYQSYNNNFMNYLNEAVQSNNDFKAQHQAWNSQKNAKVVRAGQNKVRKMQIQALKSAPMQKKQQDQIMLQQDQDMGGLFDNYK